ncbi:MAG: hypothetical protein Q7V01_13635 [Vicinamibacterales bacterium]|nr:hypothetical protein [Vicinamibacterales bacterium]
MTRRRKLNVLMPLVSLLACIVSAYTTQQGMATATSDLFVSVGVAVAGGFFLFVFSLFLMWRFPYADMTRQLGYGAVTVVVLTLAFGFSTQWSVIAMGGKDALSIHMQRVLQQADAQALGLLRQAAMEANLAPQLDSLAQQYEGLASRETRGAFSGLQGEGSVVSTLRNMSQMFANLSRTVKGVDTANKALYDRYKELSAEARKVASEIEQANVGEGETIRRNNLAFSRVLGEINEVMTRMREASSAAYVRVVNQNLGSLTTTASPGDTPAQREALVRLESLKDAAVRVVAQISAGRRPEDEAALQTFTMLPAARAVWVYAGDVFYAWAGGIAIDAIPTIFVILLTLGRPEEEDELEDERRRAALRTPAPAPRPMARAGTWPGGEGGDQKAASSGTRG